jgi:NAD(P)-dependent dehydrogenase (short-subunit alcohol dehydrogenase family)
LRFAQRAMELTWQSLPRLQSRIRHYRGQSTPRPAEAGGKALPLVCDIREEEQVEAAVAATVARFGCIDICLNNASAVRLTGISTRP